MYSVLIEPDDNGTFLVTCPDLPEVTSFGEDEEDSLRRTADAIEEALAARIAHRNDIPAPSRPTRGTQVVLPPLTVAKVELYRAARRGHQQGGARSPAWLAWPASRPAVRSAASFQDRADRSGAPHNRQAGCDQRAGRSIAAE